MQDVLPPATDTGSGFERTSLRQFTIFLENRVGRLTVLLRTLESAGQQIIGLAIEESADSALVRLICADCDAARAILKEHDFSFSITDVIAVELPARSRQPLIGICTALLAAEINIHYAYPLLRGPRGPALALYVDDLTLAARLLIKKGFMIVGESDLKPKADGPGDHANN
jgi:hypothetical protein